MNISELDKRFLGFWVKALEEGHAEVVARTEQEAARVRFALYGVRKKVQRRPKAFAEKVVRAVEEVGLRIEGKRVWGFVKAEDEAWACLEEFEMEGLLQVDEEAAASAARMREMMATGELESGGEGNGGRGQAWNRIQEREQRKGEGEGASVEAVLGVPESVPRGTDERGGNVDKVLEPASRERDEGKVERLPIGGKELERASLARVGQLLANSEAFCRGEIGRGSMVASGDESGAEEEEIIGGSEGLGGTGVVFKVAKPDEKRRVPVTKLFCGKRVTMVDGKLMLDGVLAPEGPQRFAEENGWWEEWQSMGEESGK